MQWYIVTYYAADGKILEHWFQSESVFQANIDALIYVTDNHGTWISLEGPI